MMVEKRISRALPVELRRWIKFTLLRREAALAPVRIEKAEARRVAVLAPHPDDDVIGCGGTLHKHRLSGDAVTVIYLTDGARGDDIQGPPSEELAVTRRKEAEGAAGLLGIEQLVFLGYTDGDLSVSETSTERVAGEIREALAEAVFLPFFLDNHPDHAATNRIFAAAARYLDSRLTVYAYEVWTPLLANRLVDITAAAAVKEEAIRRHASQMRNVDYAEASLGLNRYRSMAIASGRGLYEAFFAAEADEYCRLVEAVLQM